MDRRLRRTQAGMGLTPSQYQVLATIVRRGPLRLSELADVEGLNPTMLSRIVGMLEAAMLVGRRQDAEDGRVVHLSATPTGRDRYERIRRERRDALGEVIDSLSSAERRVLSDALPVLETIAESLQGGSR
jgi:DNA-binding MarR family transcriptional regulator